jgi:hypothetical protein
MAGIKGRSGGHNRKSLAAHVLAGTYRPGRHGPLAALAIVPDAPVAPPPPPPESLTERTAALWRQTVAHYEGFDCPVAAKLLELALGALDRAEECSGAERRRWQAFACGIFKQLRIGGAS